jgi:pimeloyl-ACP methyl ester carboxylesterase
VQATPRRGAAVCFTAVDDLERTVAGEAGERMLLGHSMGALVSLLVAGARPDLVAGLVLTAAFVPASRNGRSTLAAGADYARHRALFVGGSRRRRNRRPPRLTVDRVTRLAGLAALADYGLRPATFHAAADRVRCPVLLVHGGEDHYVPPAFVFAAAARHPAWDVRVISGAGHFPHRDDPAAWLSVVEPWMDQLGT